MKVLMATSTGVCGIADYAQQAIDAVWAADRAIQIIPSAEALDPQWVLDKGLVGGCGVLWLNFHRGLHSQWTPDACRAAAAHLGCKLLITFHDTRGEAEPDDLQRQLHDLADAFVVHEPVLGLPKATLIRQGVHAGVPPHVYGRGTGGDSFPAYPQQPILGTVGFNQGWREFDRLCAITRESGWALAILSCNASHEDEQRWRSLNPDLFCVRQFLPVEKVVSYLAGCDATAFVHSCQNTGTSGTLRLGLAARKPVVALPSRQYRDIREAEGNSLVRWCAGFDLLPEALANLPIQRVDTGVGWLAARDSWQRQGQTYAQLLREITE